MQPLASSPVPDDVPGADGTEIGRWLARDAQHHGYATEAAGAALKVAFDGIGPSEIWSIPSCSTSRPRP